MIARIAALFLTLALPYAGIAAPPETLSANEKAAYQKIATTKLFCSTAVGEDGGTPPVVLAFRMLLRSSRADGAFKWILVDGTTAGRLYALCGVYYTDPSFFDRAIERFRNSSEQVGTFRGCEISRGAVGSIVEHSGPGVVRLKSRQQTIAQWVTEAKPTYMTYDIVGGGWPSSLKGPGDYRSK